MRKNTTRLLLGLLLFTIFDIQAQDKQYSQFYANALHLSPSFAGANQTSRIIMHGRLQWPSLDATYIASTFSFDHYFEDFNSGVGVVLNTDYMKGYGNNVYKNLNLGLQYAYQLALSEKWTLRPGMQLSMLQNTFDSRLTWDSQYDNNGIIPGKLTGEENTFLVAPPVTRPDVSAGALLYSSKLWAGISAHHLNRPSMSFMQDGSEKLNIRTTFHAGMKFVLSAPQVRRYGIDNSEIETSISPVMLYKMQGKNDQLDLGMYFRHNYLVLGSWYRGVPVKVYKGESFNNDAIIFLIGMIYGGFNIGYSYDLTISKLAIPRSGGAHELSLTYNFLIKSYPQKNRPKQRKPTCPKF